MEDLSTAPGAAGTPGTEGIPDRTWRVASRRGSLPTWGALESLRTATQAMVASGLGAVLVESPLGPTGFLTAMDVIEAVAGGADPDTVWAGEIARPAPRTVSCTQHPADVGAEMTAYELEVVAVVDENAAVGVASALDVLSAVLRSPKEPTNHYSDR